MIDVLVYLFETYAHLDSYPEPNQLARKLSAAGFEQDEIEDAMGWLSGLESAGGDDKPRISAESRSIRLYSASEQSRLDTECRGFLSFLEDAGAINALTREIVVERALALEDDEVSLGQLKVIVLMVLWNQQETTDTLVLEELLSDEDEPRAPH
jgi:Smg protein